MFGLRGAPGRSRFTGAASGLAAAVEHTLDRRDEGSTNGRVTDAADRAGVLAILVTGAVQAGCDDDPAGAPAAPPPPSATVDGEVSDDFFTEPGYVGHTVTVTATVTAVLGPTSFTMNGGQYGDESLLVVSAEGIEAVPGAQVRVTGTVQRFGYGIYADLFGRAEDATDYVPFEGEEFLLAVSGEQLEPAPSPGSSR